MAQPSPMELLFFNIPRPLWCTQDICPPLPERHAPRARFFGYIHLATWIGRRISDWSTQDYTNCNGVFTLARAAPSASTVTSTEQGVGIGNPTMPIWVLGRVFSQVDNMIKPTQVLPSHHSGKYSIALFSGWTVRWLTCWQYFHRQGPKSRKGRRNKGHGGLGVGSFFRTMMIRWILPR